MKKRIAAIDLLFSWPPDSGARIDLKEILQRMQADYEVKLFILDYSGRPFAGNMEESVPFPVEIISSGRYSYYSKNFLQALRKAVQNFEPHIVFIADSWHIKPYLCKALEEYPKVLRFYCYETLCLKKNGVFTYRMNKCLRNHLTSHRDFWFCQWCAMSSMLRHREKFFWDEYLASQAFLPGYSRKVQKMFGDADGVICYNSFIANRIKPWNKNVHIVPSGVDTVRNCVQPFPDNKKKYILFTGRAYDFFKGMYTLIEAGEILYKKRQDFHFLCTNKGEERKEKFWELTPWYTPRQLPELYKRSYLCVVPSIWPEPFGIVALEAMAAGRPVIASRVGGLQNIITDGKDGYLVPPRDAAALAERIEFLLDNPQIARTMGEMGRKKVENHFSWDKIYQNNYPQIFDNICLKSK